LPLVVSDDELGPVLCAYGNFPTFNDAAGFKEVIVDEISSA